MIPLFKVYMNPSAKDRVAEVLDSGYIGEGEKVKEFEKKLKEFFRPEFTVDIITTNSATSAEHLIYHMLKSPGIFTKHYPWGFADEYWPGLDENSEVLTTPLTCTATNWPILANDLNLRWIDVDKTTMNMDLNDLEKKIDKNTRIIQVVHWGGYPIDLTRLRSIVSNAEVKFKTKIMVVEDCAHAFGSKYNGSYLGMDGESDFATYSLQAIKHITSIDGGFLVTPFKQFNDRARLMRWYGIDRNSPRTDFRCEGDIPEFGFKFHMNDVNAAVGMANLEDADSIIKKFKDNATYYNNALKGVKGVTLLENNPDRESASWLYTIMVDRRDDFIKKMEENGVATSRVHERNDKHSCVEMYKEPLPTLDYVVDNMVCIPVGWWVTPEDRQLIVSHIKNGW